MRQVCHTPLCTGLLSRADYVIVKGPLCIYRVPNMVAFLSSGNILRPILAKSQCWCVDGTAKFVLRISQNQYYRIELPNTREEDVEKAEELKRVLAKVLQYETTPCPFQRSFTVQLPDAPTTPVRRRPWRPPARLAKSQTTSAPELEQESADEYITADSDNSSSGGADGEIGTDSSGDKNRVTRAKATTKDFNPMESSRSPMRPSTLSIGRAVTAPTQVTINASLLHELSPSNPPTKARPREPPHLSSSAESFRSFHSPVLPLPPSPPYSNPPSPVLGIPGEIELPRLRPHTRNMSETMAAVDAPNNRASIKTPTRSKQDRTFADSPDTPNAIHDADIEADEVWSEVLEQPVLTQLRSRSTPDRRRAYSPLPLPANLFSPSSRASGHHLTTAMLQKTCSILLGPPVQLIALMLNIARKIANGATRGFAFGFGEAGETIPCRRDYSDADGERCAPWEEDNYGIALDSLAPRSTDTFHMSGSWEVD